MVDVDSLRARVSTAMEIGEDWGRVEWEGTDPDERLGAPEFPRADVPDLPDADDVFETRPEDPMTDAEREMLVSVVVEVARAEFAALKNSHDVAVAGGSHA